MIIFFYFKQMMKTTNQFDYPTGAATTYKAYKQQVAFDAGKHQQSHYK